VSRVLHLCTSDQFLHFLDAPLRHQARLGFDVHLATRVGHRSRLLEESGLVTVHSLPLTRRMAPAEDAVCLARTVALLGRIEPALVHAHNPKAGLLGMMGAALAGVTRRVYSVHGLPHVTAYGARRRVLSLAETATCHLAQRVLPVSASVEAELVFAGLSPRAKLRRIGRGSADGVDASRFRPAPELGHAFRRRLGIAERAPVLLFVGRLHREKGIADLISAFDSVVRALPDAELVLVGERDPSDPAPSAELRSRPRVHLLGELADPRPAYAAADVLVLPSFREGLPTVVLEAAAMALPTVAYRSLGIVDAVEDGVTGRLVPLRDVSALATACQEVLLSPARRGEMGLAGRAFVLEQFDPARVRAGVLDVYAELGLPTPHEAPS
jgi:glycosyltransferase involved in cell wall biosynthesis